MYHAQVDKAWNNKKNIKKVQFTDKRAQHLIPYILMFVSPIYIDRME